MRGVIWLVLLFVVAVVAATTLGSNDGLVSLYWRGWRTDLSLNLFVILILGACAVVLLSVQALNALVSLPQREAFQDAREQVARAAFPRGAVVHCSVFPEGAHFIHHWHADAAAYPQRRQHIQPR